MVASAQLSLGWASTALALFFLTRPRLAAPTAPTLFFSATPATGAWTSPLPPSGVVAGAWALSVMAGGAASSPTRSATPPVLAGCSVIAWSGLGLFSSTTGLEVIFFFESMLAAALLLLRTTAKGDRGAEAALEMFFWGLAGSALLIFFVVSPAPTPASPYSAASMAGLAGFCVKVPTWPFSSWLLKAHVEASTEFSILLSGLLVKFGVIGVLRFSAMGGAGSPSLLLLLASAGLVDALARMPAQYDLKRVVALTTVVEANWMVVCLASGGVAAAEVGYWLVTMHCVTTTSEFYTVEVIYRRYGTRSWAGVGGLAYATPSVFSASVPASMVTIGLPPSSIFAAKFAFLAGVVSVSPLFSLAWAAAFLIFLPVLVLRVWVPVWFGQPTAAPRDAGSSELAVLISALTASLIFGLCPAALSGVDLWEPSGPLPGLCLYWGGCGPARFGRSASA